MSYKVARGTISTRSWQKTKLFTLAARWANYLVDTDKNCESDKKGTLR